MKYAIAMLLVGCTMIRSASAEFIITTDTTLNFYIDYDVGPVSIFDGVAGPTTVEIVDGADIEPHVSVSNHSVLNLWGGVTQRGVGAGDFGTINIFGGLHADEDLTMGDTSTANIYGGVLADDIHASGSSVVNLYGGTFAKAGGGALLGVEEDGVINIFGWGFEIDLDPPTSPEFPHLTGFLSDGSPLDVRLFNESATLGFEQIVLHEIPEPSTFSICFIGLLLLLLYGRVRGGVTTLSCGTCNVEAQLPAARQNRRQTALRADAR